MIAYYRNPLKSVMKPQFLQKFQMILKLNVEIQKLFMLNQSTVHQVLLILNYFTFQYFAFDLIKVIAYLIKVIAYLIKVIADAQRVQ